MEFPPEFYGMAAAFWNTYQYIVFIWLGSMLAAFLLLSFSLVVTSVVRSVINT